MTVRPILIAPHASLSAACPRHEAFDGALGQLAIDMFHTLYDAKGRGLAAPQIGVLTRVFVMDAGWKDGAPTPLVFVNPEVVASSERLVTYEEGCLSIPDRPLRVERPDWVDLSWQDMSGAECEGRFRGFEAVCVQHERDHLDGILITDKAA